MVANRVAAARAAIPNGEVCMFQLVSPGWLAKPIKFSAIWRLVPYRSTLVAQDTAGIAPLPGRWVRHQ